MAKPKKAGIKLGIHKATKTFVKAIGMALGKNGQPTKKRWYWSMDDAETAVSEALKLKARWKQLVADGKTLWDEDPAYMASKTTEGDNTPHVEASKAITVADHVALYLDHLRRQVEGGQCSPGHLRTEGYRLQKAIAFPALGNKPLAALPLTVIGRQHLEAIVLRLAGRPDVSFHHGDGLDALTAEDGTEQAAPTHRMSSNYARACIKSLKACFDWLAEEGRWSRCPQWSRLWKKQVVLSDMEREQQLNDDDHVDAFTIDELKALWLACDRMLNPTFYRCLILLGLNCGFASAEVATLAKREVKQANGQFVIARYRRKTWKKAGKGAYARWRLWPETVKHLNEYSATAGRSNWWKSMASVGDDVEVVLGAGLSLDIDVHQLWFVTSDDKRLTDNNAVGQGWRRLVKQANVRPLSYKYIRKTAAHLIRNELGRGAEAADMHLSHAEGGVLKMYADRDWEGVLEPATEALRQFLRPMLNAKAKPTPKSKPMANVA